MAEYCWANDDMPDGAFFATAEETYGWETEDWVWYSEVTEGKLLEEILKWAKNLIKK
jgi:hypothetical protein